MFRDSGQAAAFLVCEFPRQEIPEQQVRSRKLGLCPRTGFASLICFKIRDLSWTMVEIVVSLKWRPVAIETFLSPFSWRFRIASFSFKEMVVFGR